MWIVTISRAYQRDIIHLSSDAEVLELNMAVQSVTAMLLNAKTRKKLFKTLQSQLTISRCYVL
ncbi:hypothetical protein VAEKB19_6480001 [Vibrio aestuarianus]|nr:hypothetical protein VAEKB19_6480001 [Vibrio aestuarianus]